MILLSSIRGQFLALKWSSISFKDKAVAVKEAVKGKSKTNSDWTVVERSVELGPVKTRNGFRTIPLDNTALIFLNEWKQYCEENGICSEFVFPVMRKGKDSNVDDMRKYDAAVVTLDAEYAPLLQKIQLSLVSILDCRD